jgi:uncharacterized protein (DUF2141 family)
MLRILRSFAWSSRRRRIATITTTLALIGATAAVAAWIITLGAGPTNGKIGTLQAPVFNAVSIFPGAADECFPGATCGGAVNVTNPNPVALKISSVTAGAFGAGVVVNGGGPGCTSANVSTNISVAARSFSPPIDIPLGTSNVTVPGLFVVAQGLHTDCQGATFSISSPNWSPTPVYTFSTG